MRKAVFFDRDGVLNVDKSYLGFIKDFEWMDGAKEALAYLTAEGYTIIVVTNQSGVARGYYTEDDVKTLHDWMCREAAAAGGTITAVYYCPYLEGAPIKAYDKKSDWRKPEPGMVLAAVRDYDIDLSRSFMIGDMPRDVECGRRAGMDGYLFTGGRLDAFVKAIVTERKDVKAYKNILVIKMSSLGDVLHSLPTLHALRQNCPDARIVWAVHRQFARCCRESPTLTTSSMSIKNG